MLGKLCCSWRQTLVTEPVLWKQPHLILLPPWARSSTQAAVQPTIFAKIFLWIYTFKPTKSMVLQSHQFSGKKHIWKIYVFFANKDRLFPLPRLQTDGARSCQGTILGHLSEATWFLSTQTAPWNLGLVCNLENRRIYAIKYRLVSMYILAQVINIYSLNLLVILYKY